MEKRTYTASVVCHAAGMHDSDLNENTLTAWRREGLLKLDDPRQSGWTRYTLGDIFRVCALAELSRLGLTFIGRNARGERSMLLATKLEEEIREEIRNSTGKPRYVFADQMLTSGKPGSLGVDGGRPFQALQHHFSMLAEDHHEAATVIVIDVAKLVRRFRKRFFDALGQPEDGELKP